MELFDVQTIEDAQREVIQSVGKAFLRTEPVPLNDALGRVLAEDIPCAFDVPGFTRSTMDGYAVRAKDTQGAGESIPAFLTVVGEVEMGKAAPVAIRPGECCYVPTGGMLPEGADAVVQVEYSEPFGKNKIAVYHAVSTGRNLILKGEDTKAGEPVLTRGTVLRAQDVGALASAGVTDVPVYEPLRIAVISTGDELTPPGEPLQPGKIYDINTYAVAGMAKSYGHVITSQQVVPDREDRLVAALKSAMKDSDIVCVSGGSSQGKKDMTKRLIDELSDPGVFTHGLAMKPGKPTILGYDSVSKTLLCGLPGHPVAAVYVLELVVLDALNELQGRDAPLTVYARMDQNIGCDAGKSNCFAVKLEETEEGCIAHPVLGKSGLISTMTESDGYLVTDRNKEGIKQGELIKVRLFR